ncbi:small ribosomal subunit protein uS7 [Candidatus Vidania fulgoroideorum]
MEVKKMSRKHRVIKRKNIFPDYKYNSIFLSKFINIIMKDGKKTKSENIIYNTMNLIKINYRVNPLKVLYKAVLISRPSLEIKKKKVGGSFYNVPIKISKSRSNFISMCWLKKNSILRKENKFFLALFKEVIDTCNENSMTIINRDALYKQAELNRAFTHFVF